MSRTGSSRGVYRQNGELIAVPHRVMKKSYAANAAAGNLTAPSTMKDSYKDPNVKAALTKYHPNAIRNRLPCVPCCFRTRRRPHARPHTRQNPNTLAHANVCTHRPCPVVFLLASAMHRVTFDNAAIPGKRFCYPRNEHTYECEHVPVGTPQDPNSPFPESTIDD